MIIAGNGIYDRCDKCKNLVKINKLFFGSLHVCVSDEDEQIEKQYIQHLARLKLL